MAKSKILDTNQISQKLNRMAYEVYEKNYNEKELLLVGIEGNGFKVAQRLEEILKKISPLKIKLSKIKIDKENPWQTESKIDFTEKDFLNRSVKKIFFSKIYRFCLPRIFFIYFNFR